MDPDLNSITWYTGSFVGGFSGKLIPYSISVGDRNSVPIFPGIAPMGIIGRNRNAMMMAAVNTAAIIVTFLFMCLT